MTLDEKAREHGFYEVHLALFDFRDHTDDAGPYSLTVDIIGDESKLADIHHNLPNILSKLGEKDGEDKTHDIQLIQDRFRQLHKSDLILEIRVDIDDIKDNAEAVIEALDNTDITFVE